MKPIIGITPSIDCKKDVYTVHLANCEAIIKAGGVPFIIPYTDNKQLILSQAEQCSALYVTGGNDIDPHYFQEEPHPQLGQVHPERDLFEIELVRIMLALNKPILGVCRGSQIINVALGGSMYQDLFAQKNNELIQHKQNRSLRYPSHFVRVEKNSLLYDIVQKERIKVNSNHHQANRTLGKNLTISATSHDGVIEAIEYTSSSFVLGVQWHPEQLIRCDDRPSRLIFEHFVKEASITNV